MKKSDSAAHAHVSITYYEQGGHVSGVPDEFDLHTLPAMVVSIIDTKLRKLLKQFPVRQGNHVEKCSMEIIVSRYDGDRKIAIEPPFDELLGCGVYTLKGNVREWVAEIEHTIKVDKK